MEKRVYIVASDLVLPIAANVVILTDKPALFSIKPTLDSFSVSLHLFTGLIKAVISHSIPPPS
jgi:hypothetical protein